MWLDFVHARAEIKTQCTVYVVISYVRHAAIYNLSQQTSPKVQKSFIFCSQGIFPSIVHIPKTHLVFLYQQHYSHPHCPVFMRTLWHKVIHIYNTHNCFPTLAVARTLSVHFALQYFGSPHCANKRCQNSVPSLLRMWPGLNMSGVWSIFTWSSSLWGCQNVLSGNPGVCWIPAHTHTTHTVLLNI